MRTMVAETANKLLDAKALWVPTESTLGTVALVAIVALAAALRFANLAALGEANHYYTAAVKSMLQSWHNLFFVAAEPGGSVSVDKPPVGLWLQTLSAFFFGVNGWGVLLPQILAGILSVMVLYHLVRRSFGMAAGLLAALALAITPVVVATDRNNTMDSTLILTLLLAAWAFIQATESKRLRYLLLGVTLVGIGFNIKMLQAYLPLPAFYALYLLGSQERLMGKLGKLALATALLLVVSLSWATMVDLTPADQRPYVGSSQDNSELNLILDYNGLNRLIGMGFGRGGNPGGGARDGGLQPPGRGADGVFQPPNPGMDGAPPQDGAGNDMRPPMRPGDDGAFAGGQGGPGGFPGGPGGSGTGQPGALRLFSAPLSKEASWLLPFGLFSALLVAFRARLRWPLSPQHQSLVLWGGWLLTSAIFFSVAGFFHEYYLVMLAPPLAALVGMGVVELWRLRQDRPWLTLGLLLIAAGGTLALQIATAQAFLKTIWWQPLVIGMFILGGVLLVAQRRQSRVALAGFACIVAAMLITPGIWSGLTTLYSSENQSLPSAYSGRASGPVNRGGLQVDQALLNYLESHTQDTTYLMAVPSSMQGADYVLATGRPVLYLGGFMGQDKVESSASLARMVAEGKLRFIYWSGQSGGQSDISTWVTTACTPVRGFDSATRNTGAPDGTTAQAGGMSRPGGLQVTLYDCKG